MPNLTDLVGKVILIRTAVLNEEKPVFVKLLALEASGLWIQSQEATDQVLEYLEASAAAKTPVFFVPFVKIGWICEWIAEVALSERKLGL